MSTPRKINRIYVTLNYMSEKRIKRVESGWIAEEIFADADLDMHSKCAAIDDQLAAGVLELDEALEIYDVSLDQYLDFFIKQQSAQAEARFHAKSTKIQTLFKIKYLLSYFNSSTSSLDSKLIIGISTDMNQLEDDVEMGRVRVISE